MTRNATRSPVGKRRLLIFWGVAVGVLALAVLWARVAYAGAPEEAAGPTEYRNLFDPDTFILGHLTPRVMVWIVAQMHLLFAAFVLAVPMFAYLIEVIGALSKDAETKRKYDEMAYEFTRLLAVSFSATAMFGALLTFLLIGLYPKLMNHMADVFGPTMYLYALVFFLESFTLYLYYYGWHHIRKPWHLVLGFLLNLWGIVLLFITNAWVSYMMSPEGVDDTGKVLDRWDAVSNFLWHPLNIHRLIANLCLGGSVVGAYAAYKFLMAKTDKERAHYDWMGFTGNFVSILALMPLPFAGYYLALEIYDYNQQLGITMMGGIFSWLFIVQAILIAALFLGMNHYLWLGMDRIEGSERYRGWIKWMLVIITLCGVVWATPHSLVVTATEVEKMGGSSHPVISKLGVMSAKNTAVNIMILATLLSFILYRRGNKVPTVRWATVGKLAQVGIFGIVAGIVIGIGVYGYYVPTEARIALSPLQAMAVGGAIISIITIDIFLFIGAKEVGKIRWGKVSRLSQYMLIFVAVSFTWLMSLMGFVRSGLRLHWHVFEVVKDTSPEAYTPTLGFATTIVSIVVLLFFSFIGFIFYITAFATPKVEDEHGDDDGDGAEADADVATAEPAEAS